MPLAPPHRVDIPGLSMSAGLSRAALSVSRVSALALSLLVADVIPRFPEISRRFYAHELICAILGVRPAGS